MSLQWLHKIFIENWPMFLEGAKVTLQISLISTVIGAVVGFAIGIVKTMPRAKTPLGRFIYWIVDKILSIYIEIFRGTPMIVQSMIIYYGSAQAFGINMNRIFAGIFIVSINTGAYISEIVRGGIYSIDKGQFEAAESIGMSHFQIMINIIMPQVFRNILPSIGNEFVVNIKDTSVLNIISVNELFFQTKSVAGNNLKYYESFFIASVLYFIMTYTVTRILRLIEKKIDGPENYSVIHNAMQV